MKRKHWLENSKMTSLKDEVNHLRGRVDRRDAALLKRKDELGTATEKMKTDKETIEELRTQLKKT